MIQNFKGDMDRLTEILGIFQPTIVAAGTTMFQYSVTGALNATTVTLDAIQYDEENEPFVYCYSRGDEIVRQRVTLGINNGVIVEVKDGVKSGETILLPKTFAFPMAMNQ